jgi:hypothetical protein
MGIRVHGRRKVAWLLVGVAVLAACSGGTSHFRSTDGSADVVITQSDLHDYCVHALDALAAESEGATTEHERDALRDRIFADGASVSEVGVHTTNADTAGRLKNVSDALESASLIYSSPSTGTAALRQAMAALPSCGDLSSTSSSS